MPSRILVIGAGWYGCHLASILQKEGHLVTIVDKTNAIFTGSSFKNQNRLHLGYHYPRAPPTIKECQNGFPQFMAEYGHLTESLRDNVYFIADCSASLITASDFLHQLSVNQCATDQQRDLALLPLPIRTVHVPCLNTTERYINPHKAAAFFQTSLTLTPLPTPESFTSIAAIQAALGNQHYDLILNCTYNHLEPIVFEHYELFMTLLYRIDMPESFAYTIMDGPFFSIYPYDVENKIYTVTHVKHCVLYRGTALQDIESIATAEKITLCKQRVEDDLAVFLPTWNSVATFTGYYTSWKTKHDTQTDDRSVRHQLKGNVLSLYGGKITGIFHAEEIVRSHLATLTTPTC